MLYVLKSQKSGFFAKIVFLVFQVTRKQFFEQQIWPQNQYFPSHPLKWSKCGKNKIFIQKWFLGNFMQFSDDTTSWDNHHNCWWLQHQKQDALKSLKLSCSQNCCFYNHQENSQWSLGKTKWEHFCLLLADSFFYIWFVFYVSLPN